MFNRRWIFVFMLFLVFLCINIPTSNADDRKGQREIIDQTEANMVLIPAGEFLMGGRVAYYERPQHKVFIDAFYIGKYEVTFEEYLAFCDDTGWRLPVDPKFQYGHQPPKEMLAPEMPVVKVTRKDAEAFCRWLSKKTGKHYRLPTEAEWEKAARGELVGKEYPWGNEAPDRDNIYMANYGPGFFHTEWIRDGYEYTAPVGSFPPNGYGLHDMAGNVWEWVQDWFADDYYSNSPYKNPRGPAEGTEGIIRGGCYSSGSRHLRCAKRYSIDSGNDSPLLGFRIARDL